MTPQQFISKWSDSRLKESAAAQEHFIDLCRLLGEKTPADVDPDGEWYAFEKGAMKTGGGDGWADVWKRGCFAWEYKSKGKDLGQAAQAAEDVRGFATKSAAADRLRHGEDRDPHELDQHGPGNEGVVLRRSA